jgi:hypothetical protein
MSTLQVTGILTGVVGVAALAAGGIFAYQANLATNDANALPAGATWDPVIQDRGQRAEKLAIGMFVGGGIAVAAGAILYVIGGTHPREDRSLAVIPERDGASAVWSCAF